MVMTFVLLLPCGCPASFVHADDLPRAAELLLGGAPPLWARGSRFLPVAGPEKTLLMESIQAAGPKRVVCRGEHNQAATG